MKAAALIGVLVMAHGGDPDWNKVVEEAVAPLRAKHPTALSYGMADPETLQDAVFDLERQGVRKIAVVRLFFSGDSFLARTEKILGVIPGAPAKQELAVSPDTEVGFPHLGHGTHGGGGQHEAHMDPDKMPMWKLVTISTFAVSPRGLLEAGLGPLIMTKRAKALSNNPAKESVLLVAHGVGDDAADKRWRAAMAPAVESVRKAAPFRRVEAVTLRDDWPEAHARAVKEIKAFVAAARKEGGKALVIPYRLFGFGPQAASLAGLDIVTDDKGLLPDPLVGDWLVREADALIKEAGWESPSTGGATP